MVYVGNDRHIADVSTLIHDGTDLRNDSKDVYDNMSLQTNVA